MSQTQEEEPRDPLENEKNLCLSGEKQGGILESLEKCLSEQRLSVEGLEPLKKGVL